MEHCIWCSFCVNSSVTCPRYWTTNINLSWSSLLCVASLSEVSVIGLTGSTCSPHFQLHLPSCLLIYVFHFCYFQMVYILHSDSEAKASMTNQRLENIYISCGMFLLIKIFILFLEYCCKFEITATEFSYFEYTNNWHITTRSWKCIVNDIWSVLCTSDNVFSLYFLWE